MAEPIPLHLVTGFLGSGKTTLVNAVLHSPAFAGTVVVVNEFGEVGLDQALAGSAADGVVLLDSGCLCCAVSSTLRDTLIDLFSRRGDGSLPAFRRVIVETSGLANPAPMIAALIGDSALTPRCRLAQVLALVDVINGAATLDRYPEASRQVALADRVVLTKSDLAPPGQEETVRSAVRALNPQAALEPRMPDAEASCHFGDVEPAHGADVRGWMRGPLRPQYGERNEVHGEAFRSLSSHVLRMEAPMDWPAYAACTGELKRRFGARLLRCKGVLSIAEQGAAVPYVVQGVQGFFARPERLPAWPADIPRGFLVCIGEGIPPAELEDTLRSIHP